MQIAIHQDYGAARSGSRCGWSSCRSFRDAAPLGGIAGNFAAGVSRSVMASGVVVDEHNVMLQWNDYDIVSTASPLPLLGTNEDAVVVGTGVARKLKLCNALNVPDCKQAAVTTATAVGVSGAAFGWRRIRSRPK